MIEAYGMAKIYQLYIYLVLIFIIHDLVTCVYVYISYTPYRIFNWAVIDCIELSSNHCPKSTYVWTMLLSTATFSI